MKIKKIEARLSKARHFFVAGAFATVGVVAGLVIYNEGRKDGFSEALTANQNMLDNGVAFSTVMDIALYDESGYTFKAKAIDSEDTQLFHINHVK